MIADIEGSKDKIINPPKCLQALLYSSKSPKNEKVKNDGISLNDKRGGSRRNNNSKLNVTLFTPPYVGRSCKISIKGQKKVDDPHTHDKRDPPKGGKLSWIDDQLTHQIVEEIQLRSHRNAIIKHTGAKEGTVKNRLRRMIEARLIKDHEEINGGVKVKIYVLTPKGVKSLIYNEEGVTEGESQHSNSSHEHDPIQFTWHACSFSAEILDKSLPHPKPDKEYRPNGWNGSIYYSENGSYTIRLTSKKAIVDIHITLRAGSQEDMLLKYFDLAQTFLGKFSERYKYPLGRPQLNRQPHRVIEGSRQLAKALIPNGGELYIKEFGLQVDKSDEKHNGEIEFIGEKGKETSATFEYIFNQQPKIIAGMHSDIHELKEEIKIFMEKQQLQNENLRLRQENTELRNQFSFMAQQVEDIKKMMNQIQQLPQQLSNNEKEKAFNPSYI